MATIAVTGAEGTVARTLIPFLEEKHTVIPIDLPYVDILDNDQLTRAVNPANVVIHLAGVFGKASEGGENWLSPHSNPQNETLFNATLQAALGAKCLQFIHASSIHVEDGIKFYQTSSDLLVAQPRWFTTEPRGAYGHNKRAQEAVLEETAADFPHGAVSIRLGGVSSTGKPPLHHADQTILEHEQRVWLSPTDLACLIHKIIVNKQDPTYEVVYAVSNNEGRFHDISNSFDWVPTSSSQDFLK